MIINVKILKRIINRATLAVAGVLRWYFHAHNELTAAGRREREGERVGRPVRQRRHCMI